MVLYRQEKRSETNEVKTLEYIEIRRLKYDRTQQDNKITLDESEDTSRVIFCCFKVGITVPQF